MVGGLGYQNKTRKDRKIDLYCIFVYYYPYIAMFHYSSEPNENENGKCLNECGNDIERCKPRIVAILELTLRRYLQPDPEGEQNAGF